MSESKDNTLTYIIVVLLLVGVFTLFSIEDEIKAQRTPEQIAAIAAQEKAKSETKALMDKQQEERDAKLVALSWGEVDSVEQVVNKAIAEGYYKFAFILMILASGPMIIRRINSY